MVHCSCGLEAVIRTSSTNQNPGRRFDGCHTLSPTCVNFLRWFDPPMCLLSLVPSDLDPRLLAERFATRHNHGALYWTELITSNLACPSIHQLLWSSGVDSGPDMSFDKSASPERLLSLACSRAPSPVCIDDNYSCMKLWKSGFFLIDRRAIPDFMVWRHPSAAIDNPRPVVSSFSMADVRRLSAHVIKLRDMPEGVLVLTGLSRVWKSRVCNQEEPHHDIRPILQRLPFYCTPPAAVDAVILNPTLEDLAMGTPSAKIFDKAEASQKRKASTSGATSSHVSKHTRSALAQSFGSTTRPSLFLDNFDDESDDDGTDYVEISLVTPIRSAVVIPSSGNQGGSSTTPVAEYSQGKGIMVDDAAAPSAGASRPRPSSGEMVRVESLPDDQLTAKMSVLHCMMILHGGEILARYRGLLQSHHEYVQSTNSRLKGFQEKFASLSGLESQVSRFQRQVAGLNYKLSSSDGAFAKSKAKRNERNKKIKSLTKSLDQLNAEIARLSTTLNQATVLKAEKDEKILRLKATPLEVASYFWGQARFERGLSMHRTKDEFVAVLKKMAHFMPSAQGRLAKASLLVAQTDYTFLNKISEHTTEPLSVIIQLEPKNLASPTNVPASRDARVSPPIAKESTVTPASESLKLSANVVPASFVVASKRNEEWVNVIVDGSDPEMTDGAPHAKSGSTFVQGTSYVLDDVAEVTVVRLERVSSGPTGVVMDLSTGEKGDGSLPSSAADEEAAANPSRA
ncbi:hypothetical protein Tco_1293080 [Tanacetum coccineum]